MFSAHSQRANDLSQVKGKIVGAFITAIFGGVWLLAASRSLGGLAQLLFFVLVALLTLGLLIGCLRLTRAAWKRAGGGTPVFADRRRRLWYIGAIVFEVMVFFIGRGFLARLHRPDLSFPLLAFVVGLHFLGLAPAFQTRRYFPTAAVFCLVALIGIVLPDQTTVGGTTLNLSVLVIGLVCGLYLWSTSVWYLSQIRREKE